MSTTTKKKAPVTYFSTVKGSRRVIDVLVISLLFILAALGFQHVYGGIQYFITAVMALVLAFAVALLAARFRWGPLRVTPLMLVIYLLLGTPFAAPTHGILGVIPSLQSLWELVKAPVTSWKSVLTIAPPVGTAQGVLAVVWISMLLLVLGAMSVVLRTRHYVIAWLFPLALMLVTIAFGTHEAFAPVIRGTLFAVISLAWLTWRFESARLQSSASTIISDSVRPGSWKNPVLRRRVIGGSLILALSLGITVAAQSLLDPPPGTQRYAVRDQISPPFDPREYVSPLADFRGYVKNEREKALFTVTGVERGDLIRLATLDQYDAQVYNVAGSKEKDSASGAFLRTAGNVTLYDGSAHQRTATVTIGEYGDVWMPTLGTRTNRINPRTEDTTRAAAMAENLYLNDKTQTAVQASGLRSGDTYELLYEPYVEPTAEQRRTAVYDEAIAEGLPANVELPGEYAKMAKEARGNSTSHFEQFQNLLRTVKQDAYYSHGVGDDPASLSGHSLFRLNAMFEDPSFDKKKVDDYPKGKIGDEEQYAVLVAVLARSVGIPARVVMGFEVPNDAEGSATITGDNVTAWVEVAFKDLGWVRFDPAPDNDNDPVQPEPQEQEKPRPQVAQPPPPPAEPPSPPPGALSESDQDDDPIPDDGAVWLIYVGLALLPLLLIGLILLAIVIAKVVRRRRRRNRGGVVSQVDGGWQEIIDLLTDLGRAPDPMLTRAELAAQLDAKVPSAGAALLASRADRAVFGPDDLPPAASDEYWSQVMSARRSLAGEAPWYRRLAALFSLRSFRRRKKQLARERRRTRALLKARSRAEKRTADIRRRRASSSSSSEKRAMPWRRSAPSSSNSDGRRGTGSSKGKG